MKKYRVIDHQGAGFMEDTYNDPQTLNSLRSRFWSLDEARTDQYNDFTREYIELTWVVEFEEVNLK